MKELAKESAEPPEAVLERLRSEGFRVNSLDELVPTLEEQDRREHRTGVAPRDRLLERIALDQQEGRAKRLKDRDRTRRAREVKAAERSKGRGGADITTTEIDDVRLRKLIDRYGQEGECSDRALHRLLRGKGYRVGRDRISRMRRGT